MDETQLPQLNEELDEIISSIQAIKGDSYARVIGALNGVNNLTTIYMGLLTDISTATKDPTPLLQALAAAPQIQTLQYHILHSIVHAARPAINAQRNQDKTCSELCQEVSSDIDTVSNKILEYYGKKGKK